MTDPGGAPQDRLEEIRFAWLIAEVDRLKRRLAIAEDALKIRQRNESWREACE